MTLKQDRYLSAHSKIYPPDRGCKHSDIKIYRPANQAKKGSIMVGKVVLNIVKTVKAVIKMPVFDEFQSSEPPVYPQEFVCKECGRTDIRKNSSKVKCKDCSYKRKLDNTRASDARRAERLRLFREAYARKTSAKEDT